MKKILIRIAIIGFVLIVVVGIVTVIFLGQIVKKGVETAGPMVTKVQVKLDNATISLLGGSAHLKGLFVGNPPGYKTESAIQVGEVSISLKPLSVLSDKIVVESVKVKSPEITIEGGIKDNNLTKILDNVNAAARGSDAATKKAEEQKGAKKIQVTDLTITGAKVNANTLLSGGQTMTLSLPDIHLTNLGTESEGMTPAELTKKVMDQLTAEVVLALTKSVADIGTEALKIGKGTDEETRKSIEKVTGGLKGLFKK
jgi:hypothetical protein